MGAYMCDLFEKNPSQLNWGIVGAGVLHFDDAKRQQLEPQDWLQTLVLRDGEGTSGRVVGSMIDFIPVEHNKHHGPLKDALKDPNIKIVSMTVTEGGYFLDPHGHFNPDNENIQMDAQNPNDPHTIFGIIVQALKYRKEAGVKPFTVMSCDNVPHNGDVCQEVTVGLARMFDNDLASWIEENVTFPNSMVDRITPATSDKERKWVEENYGYKDAAPIFCEPYHQWVLEDRFVNGRPALEEVGVQFVEDVSPYEKMKIRILNGGHASLCYPAALLGVNYVHEAMEHPTIGAFLETLEQTEIIPTVPAVPNTDLNEYWKIIERRFSNPTLFDTITRICFDGSNRQPKFIIPPVMDAIKAGRSIDGLAIVSAMWCRYCQGVTESGETIQTNDPNWNNLQETARVAKSDPKVWLSMKDIYGSLSSEPVFIEAFTKAMNQIEQQGVEQTMKQYIASKKA
jgi:mannitol 2-dehydrogenase